MKVAGRHQRTIALANDGWSIDVIDQTRLPHEFVHVKLATADQAARAIRDMVVRGAPLIGATAAYGMALAMRHDASDAAVDAAYTLLAETRPTAINLRWALDDVRAALRAVPPEARVHTAYQRASAICEDDVATCRAIGEHGLGILRELWERSGRTRPIEVLTHCNAGWLATVDFGTALAPVYLAHDAGIPVHVWVDETRPRNQGLLTAWELAQHGVPHEVIADNAGGHLMQRARVDVCITGTDRTTAQGDVCNKIGTYLKALAAHDNGVPFYVAVPHSSIDWSIADGVRDIPIEERDGRELTEVTGRADGGAMVKVALAPAGSRAVNFAFDVTPARLVTGLITERGVCAASAEGLRGLYGAHR